MNSLLLAVAMLAPMQQEDMNAEFLKAIKPHTELTQESDSVKSFIEQARKGNKPGVILVTTRSCLPCHDMKAKLNKLKREIDFSLLVLKSSATNESQIKEICGDHWNKGYPQVLIYKPSVTRHLLGNAYSITTLKSLIK